jgi:hypothetical protein
MGGHYCTTRREKTVMRPYVGWYIRCFSFSPLENRKLTRSPSAMFGRHFHRSLPQYLISPLSGGEASGRRRDAIEPTQSPAIRSPTAWSESPGSSSYLDFHGEACAESRTSRRVRACVRGGGAKSEKQQGRRRPHLDPHEGRRTGSLHPNH